MKEPRDPVAAGDLLEAVFEVASRPEYQRIEKPIPPPNTRL